MVLTAVCVKLGRREQILNTRDDCTGHLARNTQTHKSASEVLPGNQQATTPARSVRLALCVLQLLWRRSQVRHVRLHAGLARLHALALGAAVAAAEAAGPAACD
jgi:hypothetical protein